MPAAGDGPKAAGSATAITQGTQNHAARRKRTARTSKPPGEQGAGGMRDDGSADEDSGGEGQLMME
ncbi:MAG: hypothetical protein HYV63_31500 [Candidatus Schekmanbacteria bacterium]|nr:hypothetical protein [Candidatus Schekmanbacteria bacterium]